MSILAHPEEQINLNRAAKSTRSAESARAVDTAAPSGELIEELRAMVGDLRSHGLPSERIRGRLLATILKRGATVPRGVLDSLLEGAGGDGAAVNVDVPVAPVQSIPFSAPTLDQADAQVAPFGSDATEQPSTDNQTPDVSQCYREIEKQTRLRETEGDRKSLSEMEGATDPEAHAPVEATKPLQVPHPGTAFDEYVRLAVEFYHATEGPAWQGIFLFVRLVRSHGTMDQATARKAFEKVEQVLKADCQGKTTRRHCHWTAHLGCSRQDALAQFVDCWDRVRVLPGHRPLESAWALAHSRPLEIPNAITETYANFCSLAAWLQVAMGNSPIALPCAEVAELLGVESMTVSRYRRWAIGEGLLTKISSHTWTGRKGGGRATRFQFAVERFPKLLNLMRKETSNP